MNFDVIISALPIDKKTAEILKGFYHSYKKAGLSNGIDEQNLRENFLELMKYVEMQIKEPFKFEPYHQAITSPHDYFDFASRYMEALVEKPPVVLGQENLERMALALKNGENVILFANHQTEPDPQLIRIALRDSFPTVGDPMIFVAGERVVTDPLAVPFSKGTNLLCIYSKRYIDHPPEMKLQKQIHNKKTMEQMADLLKTGGKIIYVAPSGGRDRKNAEGLIEVAPFDPQSLEMFILMAKKAKTKTHFHTLALSTYDLLPPPNVIQKELGEVRICNKTKIGFFFGKPIELESFQHEDKHKMRELRAEALTRECMENYLVLKQKLCV